MRQTKLKISAGTTPKPTRDYLTALFSDLRKRYGRLIVPCVGRFTITQVAVTFLPLQLAKVEKIGERLAKQMPKDTDHVWLVPDEIAQRFTDILNKVGRYTGHPRNGEYHWSNGRDFRGMAGSSVET